MGELKSPDYLSKKAIEAFNSGYNCSQSVLGTFSDFLDLDKETALSISCGFGAGMGRLQKTCGAVTGACMVLGAYCSKQYIENSDRKSHSYSMIQEFYKKFTAKHSTTECSLLINCDLRTEEGQEQFNTENLFETVCEPCVSDAVKILYRMLDSEE